MAARKGASRREILKMVGAGTVGLSVVGTTAIARSGRSATAGQVSRTVAADSQKAVDSAGYLSDLVGTELGGYRVESVGALERGGIPVQMKTSKGARFRVDVLRFDPTEGNRGIGATSSVTVYLRNGGKGRKSTDEEHGLGAMALASELARREANGAVPPAGLLTMGERASLDAVT